MRICELVRLSKVVTGHLTLGRQVALGGTEDLQGQSGINVIQPEYYRPTIEDHTNIRSWGCIQETTLDHRHDPIGIAISTQF